MRESTSEAAEMESKGHPVKVRVIAERDMASGEVRFTLDSHLKEDEDLVFDQDRDDMRKHDHYLVEFDLVDRTGLGLRYAPKNEAFWVIMGADDKANPPCPTSPSYSDEIYAVSTNAKTLIVRNENNTIAKFSYSLGFLTADGTAVRLDPVGTNKDGGS